MPFWISQNATRLCKSAWQSNKSASAKYFVIGIDSLFEHLFNLWYPHEICNCHTNCHLTKNKTIEIDCYKINGKQLVTKSN